MKKKLWKLMPPSPRSDSLAAELGLPPLIAQLLINRGIMDKHSAESFFSPRLSDLMDPMLLKNMDKAIEVILDAVDNRRPITIFGDYDADGLTATALLKNFFSSMGISVFTYVPNRLTEGYGLNPEAVKTIADKGPGLIITVDCGISNMDEAALAKQLGMDVVVTDHHQIPLDFHPVCPVINPHLRDSLFPYKDLAGVGVAFYLALALRRALRDKDRFRHDPEPDLKNYLDLVALGTVADMVPLTGQNRILVRTGISVMRNSCWPGLQAMQKVSGVDVSNISSYDLAFKLGPRLNASGRIHDPVIGLDVLTTDDISVGIEKAEQLDQLNSERQAIESNIIEEIEEAFIPGIQMDQNRVMVFCREGWHQGVLGIVASKLLDRYYRPTIVLAVQDGIAAGSGRSIDGFDLHRAFTRLSHLFDRFGGHYHAAGLAMAVSNMEALKVGLEELAREELDQDALFPFITVDAELHLSDLSIETVKQIQSLSPFGRGNPDPVFCANAVEVMWSGIVGEKHLKLKVKEGSKVFDAIGFGLAEYHPLDGRVIDIAFTPEVDQWQGYEKVQLRIVDLETKVFD
ncbi:MAG: single-stranded-DNA-specific exonuclease RecJ [Deltaproteobacteria bacterium]|nr:single-stranded-DNA-specific exonuclease RecJ [Deltaproteobacteria bacterium]